MFVQCSMILRTTWIFDGVGLSKTNLRLNYRRHCGNQIQHKAWVWWSGLGLIKTELGFVFVIDWSGFDAVMYKNVYMIEIF